MLRFVGEDPTSLLNYVFAIKIVEDSNQEYIPEISQLYPNKQPDPSIIKSVQLFAFPDRAAIESRCFFSFIIGNTSTEFQLGFIYYYTYFDAYCVLSDYYYPDIFNHYMTLSRSEMRDYCIELTKNIYSKQNNTVKIQDTVYKLDGGKERQDLTKLLFKTFPAYDISKIIIGMLTARHVFIVAANASTCSKFAAAIPLLIEPFIWDLNLIPILPIKIKEMIDVPVPAMIGITRSEILVQESIAPHICVNCDTKHVLDYPVFEQSNSTLRALVVNKQLEFHSMITKLLNDWAKCPGFPHNQVLEKVQTFISRYLQIYTGSCPSSEDLRAKISKCLPDYLLNSQIVHQLIVLDDLEENRKKMFKRWFEHTLTKDAASKLGQKKEIISKAYRNSSNLRATSPVVQNSQNSSIIGNGPNPLTTHNSHNSINNVPNPSNKLTSLQNTSNPGFNNQNNQNQFSQQNHMQGNVNQQVVRMNPQDMFNIFNQRNKNQQNQYNQNDENARQQNQPQNPPQRPNIDLDDLISF
ncbi:hypothetical protein TRFO_35456 [Tritrichomonas foetus]|uniref:UDENN domain-containing protein n=1 Tax=Tritrichomonas foetus TaxID=1144522 RepID=A0A1J4JHE1_9EUKA|nr:hypothetical protein TRFO_35456 [Tritrichomonas foetus]|eukprot:OHS98137.1 hypothetical protein TRFO_35456 [Tritrichomonas foetus]